jgi:chromosome segregation ATPase
MFREFTRRDKIRVRQLADADGRLVSLEKDLKGLKKGKRAQKRKYNALETEASTLRRDKSRLEAERDEQGVKQRRLESDLARKNEELETLKYDKEHFGDAIDRLKDMARRWEEDVERHTKIGKDKDGEIDRLQAEVERLKAEAKGKEALQREHDEILSMVHGLTKYLNAKP